MSQRVLVVEDDIYLARNFAYSVSSLASLSLVAVVHTVADAKAALAAQRIDVCLVDLGLPDGSGLEVIGYASRLSPTPKCLVVTVFGDEGNVIAAIEAGALGYVLKEELTSSVTTEIEKLLAGGSTLSPLIAKMLLNKFRNSTLRPKVVVPESERVHLSPRESEVLDLIARGCSYQEAGRLLSIAEETVNVHLRNTYRKLSMHSRSEAVYEASRLGLLKEL